MLQKSLEELKEESTYNIIWAMYIGFLVKSPSKILADKAAKISQEILSGVMKRILGGYSARISWGPSEVISEEEEGRSIIFLALLTRSGEGVSRK